MKKYILVLMAVLFCISCKGQKNELEKQKAKENEQKVIEQPEGSWSVNKEFDERGNLIRYDSVYSWSSSDKFNNLSIIDRDSLIQSFKSRFFTNYSAFENEGFKDVFSQDSLFSKRFFNDNFFDSDFGKDFIGIDKMIQDMMARQKKFLDKYQSEFNKSENEN